MRVFGILVGPEKLTDEQYIARIRKAVEMKRRWRHLEGAMAAFLLGMAVWLLFMSIKFLGDFNDSARFTRLGHPTVDEQLVYSTFVIAGFLGFGFGFFFYKALFFIAEMFFGFRQQKLLVECWDALSDAEKGRLRQRSS